MRSDFRRFPAMRLFLVGGRAAVAFLAAAFCSSVCVGAVTAAPPVKAFPTAEGFGAHAVGGRGGRVIEVTNLDDAGPGSLRAALEASGPRLVVFRVSGTITLKNAIQVRTPYLTVAGQTSPGGVQIRGHGQPEGDWGVWFVNGAPAPPADSDHDGMPDAWEQAHGLDPDDPADGAVFAANGYTYVENYLNEVAGDPVPRF